MAAYESRLSQQSKATNGLKTKYENEQNIDKSESKGNYQRAQYQFQLDVDIRKTKSKPISQGYGKSVSEVEWIDRDGPPIVLLQIDGAKAKKEASFYVQLSCHPHIIRTYGLVQSDPGSMMLLQEATPQGNLSELLRGYEFTPNERVLWTIFEQICDAMIFLTDKNIIHGNLACRNVLVFQMNPVNPQKNLIKLSDFGLTTVSKLYSAVDSPDTTTMTIIPTRYAAPELLRNLQKLHYSEKSDVYSMGVLMWEACVSGQLPYSNINDSETIRQNKLKDKRLAKPSTCSNDLWHIINECWKLQPNERPHFQLLKTFISDLQSESIENSEREIVPDMTTDATVILLQSNKTNNSRYTGYEDSTDHDTEISDHKNERYYSYENSADSQQTTNPPDGFTSCPFCQAHLSSSEDLHDHLILCGTKTDQCPNCQEFIQRAFFAYHYENDCADINETDVSRSQVLLSHSNQKIENSSEILECEFCHNKYTRNCYEFHKDYCLSHPANTNNTLQRKSAQSQIDTGDSAKNSAVTSCKCCQKQYTKEQFRSHQTSCLKNPNRTISSANGTADSSALDPKLPLVPGQTGERETERQCCCCS